MTYSIRHVVGISAYSGGDKRSRPGFFGTLHFFLGDWGEWGNHIWKLVIGAHCSHALEMAAAVLCWVVLYADGSIWEEAKEWRAAWVARIVLFNLACEFVCCSFWHWMTYASHYSEALQEVKYNPKSQYEPDTGGRAGIMYSETGNLEREIFFNTLGWLQSAFWQAVFTHLWACGFVPVYMDFFARPVYSVVLLLAPTYWREIHFYWVHRMMHPWWDRNSGLMQGDIGAFLYRHVHSLHHKSYNPGPWSGLSMHPVEHLFYYSCATVPALFMTLHPLHFLYTKFHADISPIGGHDGIGAPGAGSNYHYLHHAKFECNYGVPQPINFDKIFGTWVDYEEYKRTGEMNSGAWSLGQMHDPEEEEDSKKEPLLASQPPAVTFTMAEVAQHGKRGDVWIALYGRVLDVTSFVSEHPGGEQALLQVAGTDVTEQFDMIHSSSGGFSLVAQWAPGAELGRVAGYVGAEPEAPEKGKGNPYDPLFLIMPCLACLALSLAFSTPFQGH